MRRTLLIFLTLSLGRFPCALSAAEHPNLDRGVDPEKLYQFGDVDYVNLQSAGVNVTVPLGLRYEVSPFLTYGFTAVWSSKPFDYKTHDGGGGTVLLEATPNRLSSAGWGWMVTLGTLISIADPINPNPLQAGYAGWRYISEDGGDHQFWATLHDSDPEDSGDTLSNQIVTYTRDGSFARLKHDFGTDIHEIETADGLIRKFAANTSTPQTYDYRLTEIRDRFGNWVDITYDDPALEWDVSDSKGRSHTVKLISKTLDGAPKLMIDYLDLAAFDGTPAHFDFRYYDDDGSDDPQYRDCRDGWSAQETFSVTRLESIQLPGQDQTTWQMTYFNDSDAQGCKRGQIDTLTLPTGGQIAYGWAPVALPGDDPCPEDDALGSEVIGVTSRTLRDPVVRNPAPPDGAWTYAYALSPRPSLNDFCPRSGFQFYPSEFLTVTVTTPLKDRLEYYFSVWPGKSTSPNSYQRVEYGLPFKRQAPEPVPGMHLSSQTWDCDVSGQNCGVPARAEYVAYEFDATPPNPLNLPSAIQQNRRLSARRTVYDDNVYGEVTYSNYDGVGHYRQETTGGTFDAANVQTTYTRFNPLRGTWPGSYSPLPSAKAWVLGTYDWIDLTGGSQTADTSTRRFYFSKDGDQYPTTGFLDCVRTLLHTGVVTPGNPPVLDTHDVLARFTGDSQGRVTQERYFGGDRKSLQTGNTCDDSAGLSADVTINHSFDSVTDPGVTHETSQYAGTTYFVRDVDIDDNSGLVWKSRDTAGVETEFWYDDLGRLKRILPQDTYGLGKDAQTEYNYLPTNGSTVPAQLEIERCSAADCTQTNRITYERIEFTGWGRPWHEVRDMPDTTDWAVRVTRYNGMGLKDRVSSWVYDADVQFPGPSQNGEILLPATVFALPVPPLGRPQQAAYDAAGRPLRVVLPDNSDTNFEYLGVQWTKTLQKVQQTIGGIEDDTYRWEGFDRQGRLFRVEEFSNPVDPIDDVNTEYYYDEAGRLSHVLQNMGDDYGEQDRYFSYDNRGFLLSEQHPEKGPEAGDGSVSYSCYDSRGHARYRDDGAATGRRLGFKYDAGERLDRVWVTSAATCGSSDPSGTIWKQFTYAIDNPCPPGGACPEARKGKLVTAYRRNVVGSPFPPDTAIGVTESYTYAQRQGRVSKHITQLNYSGANKELWEVSQEFNALGDLSKINYPTCTLGSCGTGTGTPSRWASFGYEQGLLATIGGSVSPWLSDLTYHASGMIASVSHNNGLAETIAAASHGMARPDSITITGGGSTWKSGTFGYDGAGNIKSFTNADPQPAVVDEFRYDKVSRLVEAQLKNNVPSPLTQTYGFDIFGNLISVTTTGQNGENFQVKGWNTGHVVNRLDAPAVYDAGGNLTDWNVNHYGYDLFNMMTTLQTPQEAWSYVYTADDERIWSIRSDNARSFWTLRGLGSKVLTRDERSASPILAPGAVLSVCPGGTPSTRVFCDNFETGDTSGWSTTGSGLTRRVTDYAWRGDKLVGALNVTEGDARHFGLDHLGTVRVVSSDVTGEFVAQHTYFPFGREATSTGQDAEPMKFAGYERDLQSSPSSTADDLDYLHARFSNPLMGRFLAVDPRGGFQARPQSWNLYSYVLANPMGFVDRTGRAAKPFQKELGAYLIERYPRDLFHGGEHFHVLERRTGALLGRVSTAGEVVTGAVPKRALKLMRVAGLIPGLALSMFLEASSADAMMLELSDLNATLPQAVRDKALELFGPVDLNELTAEEQQRLADALASENGSNKKDTGKKPESPADRPGKGVICEKDQKKERCDSQ